MKPIDIVYRVVRTRGLVTLTVEEGHALRIIAPQSSVQIAQISEKGFEFGCAGAGPQQLALAILLDFTESKSAAIHLYRAFTLDFVARWQGTSASIDGASIQGWIDLTQHAAGLAALRWGGRL